MLQITNNTILSNDRNGITINQGQGNSNCSGSGAFVVQQNTVSLNVGNGIESFGGAQKICFDQNTVNVNYDGFNIGAGYNILTDNSISGSD